MKEPINLPPVSDRCDRQYISNPNMLEFRHRDNYCFIDTQPDTTKFNIAMDASNNVYFSLDGVLFGTVQKDIGDGMSSLNLIPDFPAKLIEYKSDTIKFELEDHIYIWQKEGDLLLWKNRKQEKNRVIVAQIYRLYGRLFLHLDKELSLDALKCCLISATIIVNSGLKKYLSLLGD